MCFESVYVTNRNKNIRFFRINIYKIILYKIVLSFIIKYTKKRKNIFVINGLFIQNCKIEREFNFII